MKPRGFGVPFWARAVEDVIHEPKRAPLEAVLEELIAQTRLDEAMQCWRQGLRDKIAERIRAHRRDLRAAKRKSK